MTGEPVGVPSASGESNWPAWPRGRANDRMAARHVGRVFLVVVVAVIGIWLVARLI